MVKKIIKKIINKFKSKKEFSKKDYYFSLIKFFFINLGFILILNYFLLITKFFYKINPSIPKTMDLILFITTIFYLILIALVKTRLFNFLFLIIGLTIEKIVNKTIIAFFSFPSLIINPFNLTKNTSFLIPYGLIIYISYFLTQSKQVKKIFFFTILNLIILFPLFYLLIHFYNKQSNLTKIFDLVIIAYLIIYPFLEEKLNKFLFKK